MSDSCEEGVVTAPLVESESAETKVDVGVSGVSRPLSSAPEPTRRMMSGVEKSAGPNESTDTIGVLRESFFTCFFNAEDNGKTFSFCTVAIKI